jgi:hypothetical protein
MPQQCIGNCTVFACTGFFAGHVCSTLIANALLCNISAVAQGFDLGLYNSLEKGIDNHLKTARGGKVYMLEMFRKYEHCVIKDTCLEAESQLLTYSPHYLSLLYEIVYYIVYYNCIQLFI